MSAIRRRCHRPAFKVDGQPVEINGPHAALALGISIIYQELSLAPNLTVAENIALGREPRRAALADRKAMKRKATDILSRLGVSFGPDTTVGTLSIAEMQMVEIARALSANARILVMDEPTTALSSRETERLFALVWQLRQEGLAIVYISHRMAEVYELADRCSVLRDGRYIGTLPKVDITSEKLVNMMVGRDVGELYKTNHVASTRQGQTAAMTVSNLTDGRKVKPSPSSRA